MPTLYEFDTETAHRGNDPSPDTQKTIRFSRELVARPRIANGFRELDISKDADISVKSTTMYFTKALVDCHITTWGNTTLYKAIDDLFVLPPANLQYLIGAYMRNLAVNPNDPASVRVDFERPFITPPKVVVFFSYIDLGKGHNWRLRTTATDIDENGFTLTIETWSDTVLYGAEAFWVAYPEDEEHIVSLSANTADVSSQPQIQYHKKISFEPDKFFKKPSVFIALNSFDIDCKANFRINAYVNDVEQTGLVWHIDTWDDSILYSAGASIIAFND